MPLSTSFPDGNFLQTVRTSCCDLVRDGPVSVSSAGAQRFLDALDQHEFEELSIDTPMRMPLKFDTTSDEINFIAFIDLLNFGSGYRVPLHELTKKGAFDTIRFGAMSFHISGTPMTAKSFQEIDSAKVAELFQLETHRHVEKPVRPDMPFMTESKLEPTELKPLADGIVSVLNSTGTFLESKGYKDLAAFILDVTRPSSTSRPSAAALVGHLVRALPGLQDGYTVHGKEVYLFKKAQIMVYHLWLFFKDQDPERFNFDDVAELTIFSDNVIPTMLAHLGVLAVPNAWLEEINDNKDIGEEKATVLRAAAVVACDEVVKLAHKGETFQHMQTGDLDVYLWRLGKKGEYRKVPRFAWRDTVMF